MTPTFTQNGKPRPFNTQLHTLLVTLGMALAMVLFGASGAFAALTHPYTGQSFGATGTGAGSFLNPIGVTVDQGSGDVYVYDAGGGGKIYKFDETGEPVNFSLTGTNAISSVGNASGSEGEIAVDGSSGPDAGDIYVANNSVVRIYGADGSFLGELTGGETCGVAVDPSGTVYVGVYPETVRKYTPLTNPVTNANETSSMGGVGSVCNVAADSVGNLYAARFYGEVLRYEALQFGSPAASGTSIDPLGSTLAVDPATNAVVVNRRSSIAEYDSSGVLLGLSGVGQLEGSFGVAIKGGAGGELYAPTASGRIDIFGSSIVLPDAITEAASSVTNTTATIAGSVNPAGLSTTYQFEYGTSSEYGSTSPASPENVGSDSSSHSLSANLIGLSPSTTYHYRIVATNTNGSSRGEDETFRTTGPPTIDAQFTGELTQTSAVIEAQINPNGFDTSYQVEYGLSSGYGSTTASVDIGAESTDQSVSVELKGLQLGTTYHYRVVATNSQGAPVAGEDQSFSTFPAFAIEEESFSGVGSAGAILNAQVNDFGVLSVYRYEYGTSTAYGSLTTQASLGPINGGTGAPALLSGLQPDTVYHFRIALENENGSSHGGDVTFRTLPISASGLPDGRVYEMVTPPSNEDANVYVPGNVSELASVFTPLPFQASPDGGVVSYVADPTSGGNGSTGVGHGNEYVATRTSNGWIQKAVQPSGGRTAAYQVFSDDLSTGFVDACDARPLSPAAPGGRYDVLYSYATDGGGYAPVFTSTPPNRSSEEFETAGLTGLGWPSLEFNSLCSGVVYAGSSSDQSHVLFEANDALTPAAEAHSPSATENDLYDSTGGKPELVNVLPGDPGEVSPNATFGSYWFGLGIDLNHVISSDGSRIFWTDLNTGNLYVREDSGTPAARTVQVDASVGGRGVFRTAAATGVLVFFTKNGDLYAFDTHTNQTTDLAPEGQVLGVADASEDGSYIYYAAESVLASGASVGQPNLYLSRHGEGGWAPPVLVGTLSSDDYSLHIPTATNRGVWLPVLSGRTAETTPDGHNLVFASYQKLTGYDNAGRQEVYEYDSDTGRLSCVSCNPSGEPPSPRDELLPGTQNNHYMMRWISADGSRVFFDDSTALVPEDTNGKVDVYEWERGGSAGCLRSEGCLSLLSGGSSSTGSYFTAASLSGDDVFISTRAKLVDADQNENMDLYDVRVGGRREASPPACTGSGCQGVPPAPPIFATPSSVTFNGVGNFAPPSKSSVKHRSKTPTRAQQLAKALKACAKKQKAKRAACRTRTRKRYGVKSKTTKSTQGRK